MDSSKSKYIFGFLINEHANMRDILFNDESARKFSYTFSWNLRGRAAHRLPEEDYCEETIIIIVIITKEMWSKQKKETFVSFNQ